MPQAAANAYARGHGTTHRDGPTVSICTSGPAPYALLVGCAVAGAGVVVALLGLRRRRG